MIEIYSKTNCPACIEAKRILELHGLDFVEYNISESEELKEELFERLPNARSIPQIFVDGVHIGGKQQLEESFKI